MDFYEVIQTRRSVRSFKKDSIPEKVSDRVLDAARIAPSGSNSQPWKFHTRCVECGKPFSYLCASAEFLENICFYSDKCRLKYYRKNYAREMWFMELSEDLKCSKPYPTQDELSCELKRL